MIEFCGFLLETLPEAQGTQGIDSLNLSYLSSEIECHLHWLQIWPMWFHLY